MSLFVPSSRLLPKIGDSQNASKLVLASSEWFQLQNNVQALLALPSDYGEYQTRYGDPTSGLLMKECFDAMHTLRDVASNYGTPMGLRATLTKNPRFLATDTAPQNDAYTSTAWTLYKAGTDSFKLASALKGIPKAAKGLSPDEIVQGIKAQFISTDGILDDMHLTVTRLENLIRQFKKLEDKLAESQSAMEVFTGRSSKTMTSLNAEIGELTTRIAQLQKDRDAAYKKWLDLTIAAVTMSAVIAIVGVATSVILAAPTAGTSLAVGGAVTAGVLAAVGGGLGVAAGIARTSYENLVDDLDKKNELIQKRTAYRHDLGAMDSLMKFTLPASSGLGDQLGVIKESWESSIREIGARVGDLSAATLASGPWLKEQEMAGSAANWSTVYQALSNFVIGSFVDYRLVAFGQALPKDDPKWLENLAA